MSTPSDRPLDALAAAVTVAERATLRAALAVAALPDPADHVAADLAAAERAAALAAADLRAARADLAAAERAARRTRYVVARRPTRF